MSNKNEDGVKTSFWTRLKNFFSKIGNWIWAPILAIVTFLVCKGRNSLNKEIKDLKKQIKEDKKEIEKAESQVEETEKQLKKEIQEAKDAVKKGSDKKDKRDDALDDFLPGLRENKK